MAGEDARLNAGLKSAEDELNLIKNQVQQTLLDIREHILDVTNPFNSVAPGDLDDGEEMSIEEGGVAGAAGESGDGEGSDGEGTGAGAEEDIETIEEDPEEEILMEGDGGLGEEFVDEIPEDEYIEESSGGGGGGGGGGLMDMLEGADAEAVEGEDEVVEGFEPDQEEMPDIESELEEAEDALTDGEPVSDAAPGDGTGDGVSNAVAAALSINVDLLTMASLVRWTAMTRERIGANRMDILLDACEMAGRITPQMKSVIHALSALGDEDEDGIPVRDVVTAMVRMDGVLNAEGSMESNRLLGLLLDMDEDPLDYLAA